MKKQFLAVSLVSLLNINFVSAESIYECGGVIQNRPCAAKQNGRELTNLPPISRYANSDQVVSANDDSMRARPRPDSFEEPVTDQAARSDALELTKSAVQGKTAEDLVSRSSRLKEELAKGTISVPQAEAESIRLRVLHDTLCTKQVSSYDPRWDESCRKSGENIQHATSAVRDAKTRL